MIFNLLHIFLFNIKLNISRSMQYRSDFLINFFLALTLSSVAPLIQYLIFTRTNGYPGWTIEQIILFQGCLLLWGGIKNTLFGQIRIKMNQFVQKGLLDKLLLKPYPVIGSILSDGFNFSSGGSIIAGIIIIVYSIHSLSIHLTFIQILFFISVYIVGLLFYSSILILFCAVNVLIIFIGRLGDILDKIMQFSEYPIEIFPQLGKFIFITIIPIAVWIYFPAQILLDRFQITSLIYLTFICVLSTGVSLSIWCYAIKRYTSAGG